MSQRPAVSGSHRPVGVFGARGPAIRRGLVANELSILDVAPTVLYSLGLPLPEELQGRVPVEIYDDAFVKSKSCEGGEPRERDPGLAGAEAVPRRIGG